MNEDTKNPSEMPCDDVKEEMLPNAEANEMELPYIPTELEKISAWVSKVKFRKKLIGGVDEADVWKKIEELNTMYEFAIAAERTRFNVILEEYKRAYVASLKKNIKATEKKKVQADSVQNDSIQGEKVCDE